MYIIYRQREELPVLVWDQLGATMLGYTVQLALTGKHLNNSRKLGLMASVSYGCSHTIIMRLIIIMIPAPVNITIIITTNAMCNPQRQNKDTRTVLQHSVTARTHRQCYSNSLQGLISSVISGAHRSSTSMTPCLKWDRWSYSAPAHF